jgi:hypothetical protein
MPLKHQRSHQFKKKSDRPWRIQLEREVQNLKEPIMLQWPYLWIPLLDDADIWIYCSSPTTLLTDRTDLTAHNPFDKTHHRQFPGKKKENTPAGQFLLPTDFSLFHCWRIPIFGYVVRLDVAFILDSGDQKCTLRA